MMVPMMKQATKPLNLCKVEGCGAREKYLAHGLCRKHYLDIYRDRNRDKLNRIAREKYAADREYRRSRLDNAARFREKNHGKLIARNAARHAAKKLRTPAWADLGAIRHIYETCPDGWHVDHIIPLQGTNVSGLHVHGNLQHLPADENVRKGNDWSVL